MKLTYAYRAKPILKIAMFREPLVLGSKFTGPNGFADTQNGVYWEVLPKAGPDELRLQKALLKKD